MEQERAVWYVREYFQRFSAGFVPHLQRTIRGLGLAKKIPGLFMKVSLRSFGPDAGFEYEFPERSGSEARFNIVKCPYFDTCLCYGCPEITRAFLHDAPFLLLDEPTSNLDSLNEAVILKSLKEEAKGKTVVLVSHRKSTVRIAERIIEMEDGRVS